MKIIFFYFGHQVTLRCFIDVGDKWMLVLYLGDNFWMLVTEY